MQVFAPTDFFIKLEETKTPKPIKLKVGNLTRTPTRYLVSCKDGDTRRVYCTSSSLYALPYVFIAGEKRYIRAWQMDAMRDNLAARKEQAQ